jgi:hypothetical protein
VDDTLILDAPWPPDLDPAIVPFRAHTVTILRRLGFVDDPSRFDTLTEAEVLSWTNAGPRTVADIRATGNEAIRRHHERVALLPELRTAMAAVAEEPWARHIWWRDPRFARYLPKVDATVYDIATGGTTEAQEALSGNLNGLRAAVKAQAARTLGDAVAEYVEAVSSQHGDRLEMLLARSGLGGQDPITGVEAARRLGVSSQRISQLVGQLRRRVVWARPPAGVWMPQVENAEQDGWPKEYTAGGVEATRGFLQVT